MDGERPITFVFRWDGSYWGFLLNNQLYDRYGRHAGWAEGRPHHALDLFHLSGRFMGELVDGHFVLRSILRTEPVPRGSRPPIPTRTPPDPPASRGPADPRDGWSDALPWPLRPPDPPRH